MMTQSVVYLRLSAVIGGFPYALLALKVSEDFSASLMQELCHCFYLFF